MLIIEGTDCVGKTTLAHKLAKKLSMVYQHLGPLPDLWYDEDYVNLASPKAVRDRYHLSEMAYSSTLKRNCKIRDLRVLHATLLLKCKAFVVLITADPTVIGSRYDAKRELFNVEDVIAVNDVFENGLKAYGDYRIHLTSDQPDILDVTVDKIAESYTRRLKWIEEWSDIMRNSK
jgi:thymidylate kinase